MSRPIRRVLSVAHSYCVALNRRLAHEMARAGTSEWEVTAVAPASFHGDLRRIELERITNELCTVEPVPAFMTSRTHLFLYGRRLRELSHQRWDLVHCWEEPYIVAGGQVAWWTPRDVPLVFWTAQNISKRYPPPFSLIEKYCLARCAGWMGSGQLVIDTMLARGYGRKPHRVMPLGVDLEKFRPDGAARAATRDRLGWTAANPPVAGYLGRFVAEKGTGIMMRALDRISRPWRALLVGGGPMEPELRQWAARHGDRVRIVTGVTHDQVPAYLNAIDLLCVPSRTIPQWREQFGRIVVEAFACGVPVVASDSGELPYVAGDAAVVVPESDEDAWVEAIGAMLDNPALRTTRAQSGIDRASRYAWSVVARRHLQFFSELIGEGAAGN